MIFNNMKFVKISVCKLQPALTRFKIRVHCFAISVSLRPVYSCFRKFASPSTADLRPYSQLTNLANQSARRDRTGLKPKGFLLRQGYGGHVGYPAPVAERLSVWIDRPDHTERGPKPKAESSDDYQEVTDFPQVLRDF